MTSRVAFGMRAVIIVVGPARYADFHTSCLRFGEAGLGEFRFRISCAGDGAAVEAYWHAEQRIADDKTGLIFGRVRERRPAP